MSKLATGIDVLDRKIDGGVPSGSIVLLEADGDSQSELFLNQITLQRDTVYITTLRSEAPIQRRFENENFVTGGDIKVVKPDGADLLASTKKIVQMAGEGSNIIIDVVDPLEKSEMMKYAEFLNELQTHLQNTDSIAVIHGLRSTDTQSRAASRNIADVVMTLETRISGDDVENRLIVPKFRGRGPIDEVVKVELQGSEVTIDTSRDIA